MKDLLSNYFAAKGDAHTAQDYFAFSDWIHDHRECSKDLTSGVFANIDLKKAMAKKIVSDMMNHRGDYAESGIMDRRLRALVNYYFNIQLFSQDPEVAQAAADALGRYRKPGNQMVINLSDSVTIADPSEEAIVTMRPEDDFYRGYRFFIINLQCFTSRRFVIGFRTDTGPVRGPMKYYKGCRPMGTGRGINGQEWNLIECDDALSDDNLAIISNQLDGDGTIEICDWIDDKNQRVIFRCNY